MTPELYKYWHEGGKLEYRHKGSELWHTLEARTKTPTLTICDVFEFRKKKNPHKYAEIIKAWADGADIETRIPGGDWVSAELPIWYELYEYRVKSK